MTTRRDNPFTRPPHPATVAQPRTAVRGPASRPPHPATVVQAKPTFTGPSSRPPHPATLARAKGPASTAQARFVKNGTEMRPEDVAIWFSESISMGDLIPSALRPALEFLARQPRDIDLATYEAKKDPPAAFIKGLEQFQSDYGDRVSIVDYMDDRNPRYYYGGIYKGNLAAFDNWDLGNAGAHAVPNDLNPATHTELAHVTYKTDYLHNKRVDPNYGNAGEFGSGFYLTTGHATAPQTAVSLQWGSVLKGYPKCVIRFRIPNAVLTKLIPGDAQGQALLLHMLQNASGYPHLMNEQAAIVIMNRVNVLGNVLLFPDTKSAAVSIATNSQQDWDAYTQHNSGASDHILVVGPQRPPALVGIRQIAVRGARGDHLINSYPRSLQEM